MVDLTNTEFRLLHLMMERIGRVQTRENLLVNVWNYDSEIETRTVDNHIGRLRAKLGDKGDFVKTVRGVGYKPTTPRLRPQGGGGKHEEGKDDEAKLFERGTCPAEP